MQEGRKCQATCPCQATSQTARKRACRLRPGRHAFELSADARILAAARGKGSRSIGELAER
eukprot:527326-Pleurochrysis_carterae.AAC.1